MKLKDPVGSTDELIRSFDFAQDDEWCYVVAVVAILEWLPSTDVIY